MIALHLRLIPFLVVAAVAVASSSEDIDYNSFEHDEGLFGNNDWKNYEPKVNINQPLPDGGQMTRLRPCAMERFPEENLGGKISVHKGRLPLHSKGSICPVIETDLDPLDKKYKIRKKPKFYGS